MEAPVPIRVPPQELVYQFHVASVPSEPPFTLSVKLVPDVAVAAVELMEVGAVLNELTVTFTLPEVTLQPLLLVTTTV